MKPMERKICTKCQMEKQISEYYISDTKRGYHQAECKDCNRITKKKWRERIRNDNRANILQYLGGSYQCTRCGFTHSTSSPFDWHHLDSNIKEASPMLMIHNNWEKLKKELDKCQFLCACCHRIEHHG